MINYKLGERRAKLFALCGFFFFMSMFLQAQEFLYGADQSYVNEMEDCGVVYRENGNAKDVYEIYKDYGSNLVRLRLWHTPSWYDNLNDGKRYSDLADVKKAIGRAKANDMKVLLDFHLSDTWADPSKQFVPKAWESITEDLPVLKDSLYKYIYRTLEELHSESLLPEMVQIGNETNKGILQSEEDNATWKMEWPRNAELFNSAIEAVRKFSEDVSEQVKIMVHFAGPEDAIWLSKQFHDNGVTDFDMIGLSYYWAWHQPTTIARTGEIVKNLIGEYGKEVMVVETGYIWTTASNDSANNIISETNSAYGPASPESQKAWLLDLKKELQVSGASGMIYWEPSWVSSTCRTLWGQGSHQEHAAFFDFDNNLLLPGGIEWMSAPSSSQEIYSQPNIEVWYNPESKRLNLQIPEDLKLDRYMIADTAGQLIQQGTINRENVIDFPNAHSGVIVVTFVTSENQIFTQKVAVIKK